MQLWERFPPLWLLTASEISVTKASQDAFATGATFSFYNWGNGGLETKFSIARGTLMPGGIPSIPLKGHFRERQKQR